MKLQCQKNIFIQLFIEYVVNDSETVLCSFSIVVPMENDCYTYNNLYLGSSEIIGKAVW